MSQIARDQRLMMRVSHIQSAGTMKVDIVTVKVDIVMRYDFSSSHRWQ